ncbi:ribosome-associated ATPase/putative transporter RbbA [Aliarcobacter butzleri]|jgi:ribosome-dependent ATPase|uniref:ribosome-associated ATPase/putative transporter RbbA n=1 Tax=Aliarcobacter butzleri TaxID=28197 RepID=UPI001B49C08F|nr:ribosome-associated ATPase/putative transporter RbbA [Aliarcobacter butzleri]MBP6164144.1 ribosome-associated ATPase/putative transporter RbbA [Aliarcobacter sp.]MBP7226838.1 ribosome-associated ATPase/putative transporter RbbA [Aliarcobacter sp.]MBP9616487.1 ribosome-associated ATPase/putative transporter RbbA [Aliarcobacter sp.]
MNEFVAKVTNLSHKYSDVIALDNITLNIESGKMIGFIGPDGVGKSTLLSILSMVKIIQTGEVEVLNGDIKSKKYRNKICPRIAYMPQGLGKNLYMTLSVYENIEFFARLFGQDKKERNHRILQLLESTGLLQFKDRPAGKLSGGMKQKLGLCCALIHDPELLILDEPTTGVDPLSRRDFWKLIASIKSKNQNMSVLIATAYMQEAASFDTIIAMDDGKILMQGTLKELLEKTKCDNIDEAFIELLPQEKKEGHKKLVVPPKDYNETSYAIEAQNLTMQFGDFIAVNNVNLKIKQGEIFGFLGSNGCGKTTTMKMLTGLLSPTSGSAKLFGEEVKDNSLQMKEKVGYMTQSFSLYNELSILENLELHAKLFHIKEDREKRINYLLEKFDLKEYKNSLANELPLGIKQRLSLSAAVIHRPKMLILDEPTSGVDPISRDNFWELLIDLSRNDNVTIFVSTHFMNEGARCDRISLMHQGKVLITDTPKQLVKLKNKDNLEEAFISYLEDVLQESSNEEKTEEVVSEKTAKKEQKESSFSLLRVFGYSYRESLELLRDKVRLTFALLGTVILMFVIGYGITMDVENLKFAVLDQDKTQLSRNYIENIAGSRYFLEKGTLNSFEELDDRMKSGEISLAFVIPPNFGKNLTKGYKEEIAVWIDGTFPFRAETIHGYVQGLHYNYLQNFYKENLGIDIKSDTNILLRYRYNQDFKSIYSIVPAVIPMLLIFIPAILMALSVVREKELGSITNFYATPVTKLEFLLGKQLPYVIISMISFFILVSFSIVIFGVPLKGSFFTLSLAALLYIICTTGIGLLMSSFAKTQIAALAGTAIFTLLPTVQFAGLKDPVSSLEGIGKFIGDFFPVTYFINVSRGVFSKNVSFAELHLEFFALGTSAIVITMLSLLVLKKQEK